jgi:hypothetical protein
MLKITLAIAFTSALFLGGCATKPVDNQSGTASTAATSNTPRATAPVVVPAAASRRVVMAMTGPKQVTESKDWPEFKREWRETFGEHAKAAGIQFTFVDGDTRPVGEDGTLLMVTVADYRIVGIGARIFLGIMTGNAFIDAKIKFANLRDGASLGEQQHNTTSSAWSGIFAKVTPQQVDAIATEVFRDLKAAK